jgi:40S ribosomal protein S4 C-terminus
MVTGGRNMGRVGVVTHRERHDGGFNIVHIKDAIDNSFATRESNVFVIGKEKPWISLPKGKGVKVRLTSGIVWNLLLTRNSCLLQRREIVAVLFRWHSRECEVTARRKEQKAERGRKYGVDLRPRCTIIETTQVRVKSRLLRHSKPDAVEPKLDSTGSNYDPIKDNSPKPNLSFSNHVSSLHPPPSYPPSQTTPIKSPTDQHSKKHSPRHSPTSCHSTCAHPKTIHLPKQRTQRRYVPDPPPRRRAGTS